MLTIAGVKETNEIFIRFVEYYRLVNRKEIAEYIQHQGISKGIQNQIDKSLWRDMDPSFHSTLGLLNSGDCAVAALAVAEAMRQRGFSDFLFHTNGGHYYISAMVRAANRSQVNVFLSNPKVDNIKANTRFYFDAFHPMGTPNESDLLAHANEEIVQRRSGDVVWFTEVAFPDDHVGKELVTQFVRFYNTKYLYPYAISDGECELYEKL